MFNEKLSQYELAEKLGFSRGKLSNYEQGTRQPNFDNLKIIADYFEVSVDFLLGRNKSIVSDTGDAYCSTIQRAASKMSADDREKAINMLKIMFEDAFSEDTKYKHDDEL